MSSCSIGCASTLSLMGTVQDPGPVTMGSAGTNHDGSSGVPQGCWRRQEAEQGPTTARSKGELSGAAGAAQAHCRAQWSAGMLATARAHGSGEAGQWWQRAVGTRLWAA